ncbi:heptaprenyl diphosphate synthase [Halobacillus halophilus]|uniref:Heptaprenyl diphosphate synthase component I n=1 Tax=Halobacillus halophilus (strain ATCC 35676 / DSM 2266 / JCM 20832 / KCTC 3685 / LMG 17431 / NBRC 102448 / NCIMB 2269) TaxID=866895 RepID=I0JNB0_HALH3|nr:heptaprenyl diphosphate synthase component 1 [Halobacillus halophilus]ASF39692.1 heptaprenyl diphosphate synthase [Halobacillus halophilus]CCG45630.1 heptaprenyl diphosphate synthase component I [Halobacillus halophilus DSM 2266]
MIKLNSSDHYIKQLKQKIESKVRHPFLARFIPEPAVDEDKLVILSSIMDHTSLSSVKKEQYIITTMLVQIALDTHDLVTLTEDDDDQETIRNRQLTVLAGDYYSGLYYYLLSQLEDIPMIQTLAGAIKEINELKMELYYKDVESFQEFLNGLKKIESLLIQRVASYVQRTTINDIAGEWLLAKKLLEEKKSYQEGKFSPLIDVLVKRPGILGNSGQVIVNIEQMLQSHVHRLEATVSQLPIHFNWLKSHVHSAIHHQFNQRQIAEEG